MIPPLEFLQLVPLFLSVHGDIFVAVNCPPNQYPLYTVPISVFALLSISPLSKLVIPRAVGKMLVVTRVGKMLVVTGM